VASNGEGVDALWSAVGEHRAYLERSGELARRREQRIVDELRETVVHRLERDAFARTQGAAFDGLRDDLVARRVDPYTAADRLLSEQ
jgi:LAO/AO transport system kinase